MASKIAHKYMEFIGTGVGVSSFRARALQNSCGQASSVGVSSFRARVPCHGICRRQNDVFTRVGVSSFRAQAYTSRKLVDRRDSNFCYISDCS